MNRQLLESLYYKEREVKRAISDMCLNHPEIMSPQPLAPEFVLHEKLEFGDSPLFSEASEDQSQSQSLTENLTLCSNLSRVDSFRTLYREVFQKRSLHSPLVELEKDADESFQWYYVEEKGETVFGPFSSSDLDQRFKWGILKEKSKMKSQLEEEYSTFSVHVKKYVSKLISDRVQLEGESRKRRAALGEDGVGLGERQRAATGGDDDGAEGRHGSFSHGLNTEQTRIGRETESSAARWKSLCLRLPSVFLPCSIRG